MLLTAQVVALSSITFMLLKLSPAFNLGSEYDVILPNMLATLSVYSLLTTGLQLNIVEHIEEKRSAYFLIASFAPGLVYLLARSVYGSFRIEELIYLNAIGVVCGFVLSYIKIRRAVWKFASYVIGALLLVMPVLFFKS